MALQDDIQSINESLRTVGANVRSYRDDTDSKFSEVSARVQHMEQVVAKAETGGASFGYSTGPAVGESAVRLLEEDGQFAAAVAASTRGVKIGQFASRINLDNSIRAALTNDGAGQVGDTSMPSSPERRGVVDPMARPLRLLDVLPSRPTTSDSVEFVQLTTTGDAAEQEHEGDPKAELDFDGALQRAEIVTIAGWTTASKQVLSDRNALAAQIDRVIRNKVLSRLENRIINGVGGQGKINGLVNQATAYAPVVGETVADIIGEALQAQSNDGYQPNLVLMNPLDWFRLQITRNNETDEEYLFGSPTLPLPPSLWNTRVVTPASMPAGTVLTIDTSFVTVLDREQMSVMASNTHADYFIRNLVAILGELRAGLEILDTRAVFKLALPSP